MLSLSVCPCRALDNLELGIAGEALVTAVDEVVDDEDARVTAPRNACCAHAFTLGAALLPFEERKVVVIELDFVDDVELRVEEKKSPVAAHYEEMLFVGRPLSPQYPVRERSRLLNLL